METAKLDVEIRSETGKGAARKLRQAGKVPAVLYGNKSEAISLTLNPLELVKTMDKKKRRNSVFSLAIAGEGAPEAPVNAMIKEADIDPVSQNIRHMDFIRVDMDKTVLSRVPLSFVGTPQGVVLGGTLQKARRDVMVESTPGAIPAEIELDIAHLNGGDAVHVGDLKLPEGVTCTLDPKLTLARVEAPRAQEGHPRRRGLKSPTGSGLKPVPPVPNKHHVARCWTWKPGNEIRPEPTQHRLHGVGRPGGVYVCQRDPRPFWRAPLGGPDWERQTGVVRPAVVHEPERRALGPGCQVLENPPDRVIVIHDEMDVPYGRLKLQNAGGHGGHNGLRSIIKCLGTKDFLRVRFGVGRPPPKWDPADYVLGNFDTNEQRDLPTLIDEATESVLTIIRDGLPKAMNTYNRRDL